MGEVDKAIRVGRMDDISLVDLADPGDAVDRGRQLGITEIDVCVLDNSLVALYGGLELSDLGLLGIDQLAGSKAFRLQWNIAAEVGLGILELSLIAIPIRQRLIELGLKGTWINFGENIALVDGLSLNKAYVDQGAGDLAT